MSRSLFPELDDDAPKPERNCETKRGGRGQIICGDSRVELAKIQAESIQCCITSPPYWGLRDYGIAGQIGSEMKLNDYIRDLVLVFSEVKRVLSKDGTLWLNIGDSYTSGGRTWRDTDKKNPARGMDYRAPTPDGLKPKDLIGVPWRIAFALQADGWFLRSDIIWNKNNGLPESVNDRPSRMHEYVFLFSKSKHYFYDNEAVKEQAVDGGKRNCRSVWTINTEPLKEAHFATFPQELVSRCMAAGSKVGSVVLDPFFGSGTVGVVSQILGREFIGIELNSEYIDIAKGRLKWRD